MPILPQILLGAYLLFLVAAGWRLWSVGWTVPVKVLTALALVLPMPLLFILRGVTRTDVWSDVLIQMGLTLLLCGIVCVAGGLSAARLRARRK